jgi:sulfite reductase alpha subunit-like flavoprotein
MTEPNQPQSEPKKGFQPMPIVYYLSGFLLLMAMSFPWLASGEYSLEAFTLCGMIGLFFVTVLTNRMFSWIPLAILAATIHGMDKAGEYLPFLLTAYSLIGLNVVVYLLMRLNESVAVGEEAYPAFLRNQDGEAASGSEQEPSAQAAPAAKEAPAPAKKQYKPVQFDLKVAATGVSVVFGTESGNSEQLAQMAVDELKKDGHAVQLIDAGVLDVTHLQAFSNLLIIASTWGEGDPPSNCVELMGQMKAKPEISMKGSQFSVLSLGDTNYEFFCQCGKDFDTLLESYGAERLAARVDCDLDYEKPYATWLESVKAALKSKGLKTVPEFVEKLPEPEPKSEEEAPKKEPEVAVAVAPAVEDKAASTEMPAVPVTAKEPEPAAPSKIDVEDPELIAVLWGSETGNAESLADMTKDKLVQSGFKAKTLSMADVSALGLTGYKRLLVLTSTWGDGDPPSNAVDLVDTLKGDAGIDMTGIDFSVLALGDTSYPEFCKCGKDFDELFEKYGAKRIHPRTDCDLDYDAPYQEWITGVVAALKKTPVSV